MAGIALPGMPLAAGLVAFEKGTPLLPLVLDIAVRSVVHVAVHLAALRNGEGPEMTRADGADADDAPEICWQELALGGLSEAEFDAFGTGAAQPVEDDGSRLAQLDGALPGSPEHASSPPHGGGGGEEGPSIEECSAGTTRALAVVAAALAALREEMALQEAEAAEAEALEADLGTPRAEDSDAEWVLIPEFCTEAYAIDGDWLARA